MPRAFGIATATTTTIEQTLPLDIHHSNAAGSISGRTPIMVSRNDVNDDESAFYYEIRSLSKQLFPGTTASVSSPPVLPPKKHTSNSRVLLSPTSTTMVSCKVAAQRNVDLLQQSGLLEQERALLSSSLEEESYLGIDVTVGNSYAKRYTTTTPSPTKKSTYYRFASTTTNTDVNSVVSLYPDPDLLTILDSQSSVTSTSTLLTRNHSQPSSLPPRLISRYTSTSPAPSIESPENVQEIPQATRYRSLRENSLSTLQVHPKPNAMSTESTTNTQSKDIITSTMDQHNISAAATQGESLIATSSGNNIASLPVHQPQMKKVSTQRSAAVPPKPWNDNDAQHSTLHSLKPTTKTTPLASARHNKTEISSHKLSIGAGSRKVTPRGSKNSKNYNSKQSLDTSVLSTKVLQPSTSYGQSCRPPRASKREAIPEERSSSTRLDVRRRSRRRSRSPTTTATNIARVRSFMNGSSIVRNDHEHYTNSILHQDRKFQKRDISRHHVAKSDKFATINNKIPPPSAKLKSLSTRTKDSGHRSSTIMSRASKSGKRNHRRIQSNNGPIHSNKIKNNNPKGIDYLWVLTRNGMDSKLFEKLLSRAACWMFNPDGSVGTFSSDGSFMSTSRTSCSPNNSNIRNFNDDDLALDRSVDNSVISTGFMVVTVAAVVIQTLARKLVARFQVLDRMCAVIVCQAYTRFFLHRRKFMKLREATIQIQSIFRGFVDRFWVKARCYCATKIQSVARTWFTKPRVLQPYHAVIKLQSLYRGYSLRLCLDVNHFYSIQIQRVFRGYAACKRVRRILYRLWLQQIVQEIIVMQSLVRRRAAKEFVTLLRFCTVMIQSYLRTCQAQRHLLIHKSAATQIQTQWRAYFARLCYQFVLYHIITIQAHLREVLGRKKVMHLVVSRFQSSISIQTRWRGFLGRQKYSFCLLHIIQLQSCIRCFTCKTKRQQMILSRANNATTLQKCWRGFMASICYKFVVYDIITIQSFARMSTSKFKRQELTAQNFNVLRMQKLWRCFIARSCYKFVLYDILTIQFYAKRFLRKVRQRRLTVFRLNQVIRLQNFWRGSIARLCYRFVLEDIITIQSFVRKWHCIITKRRRDFIRKKSAMLMQSCWRSFLGRIVYKFVLCDIIAIQSLARLFLFNLRQKRLFFKMSACATLFQTRWRTYLSKMLYNASLYVIIIFQACVRRHLSRTCYKFVLVDIVTIQSCARRLISSLYLDRKREETNFLMLQATLYGAATDVQKSWRMHVCRYDYVYQVASVMLIQSVVRGGIIRKAFYSYTEGYRQFHMTSPFRKGRTKSQKDETFPESRFLRYLLRRKIPFCKEQAISFLKGVPERFKRDIMGNKGTPSY